MCFHLLIHFSVLLVAVLTASLNRKKKMLSSLRQGSRRTGNSMIHNHVALVHTILVLLPDWVLTFDTVGGVHVTSFRCRWASNVTFCVGLAWSTSPHYFPFYPNFQLFVANCIIWIQKLMLNSKLFLKLIINLIPYQNYVTVVQKNKTAFLLPPPLQMNRKRKPMLRIIKHLLQVDTWPNFMVPKKLKLVPPS